MPRSIAIAYILLSFYRRLFMAIVIIGFFDTPTLQMMVTLCMNLIYACFVAGTRLIEDSNERRAEIFN